MSYLGAFPNTNTAIKCKRYSSLFLFVFCYFPLRNSFVYSIPDLISKIFTLPLSRNPCPKFDFQRQEFTYVVIHLRRIYIHINDIFENIYFTFQFFPICISVRTKIFLCGFTKNTQIPSPRFGPKQNSKMPLDHPPPPPTTHNF